MLKDYESRTVAEVLRIVNDKGIHLDKVFLQKFIYFLNTQGAQTGFRFRPYTYGPFSFELANTIESMAFWDAIEEGKTEIKILDLSGCEPFEKKEKYEKMTALLDEFVDVLSADFSFKNLECVGTVLYCAQALSFAGEHVTEDSVVSEFKQWKGKRYPEGQIKHAFQKLLPYLKFN